MSKEKMPRGHFLKYTASSFFSSLAEEGVFLLLTWLLGSSLAGFALALVPMAAARVVSCFINFYINRRLVFHSQRPVGAALLRYFLQAIPVATLQILLTYGLYALCDIGEEQVALRGVIYAGVMTALFIVSFLAQKFWVFSATEKAERGGDL